MSTATTTPTTRKAPTVATNEKTDPARNALALHGGEPVRADPLPYGRQVVDEEDIAAVVAVLRSDWLTTGPAVTEFERAVADVFGADQAVAVSNGTAALHTALAGLGIGAGDEVIVPAITFAATANAALYQGAVPRFADVDPGTLLIDPAAVGALVGPRTAAVIAVDFAGQPCDYDALRSICLEHRLALVADACHAAGASADGRPVGTLADATCFSFHPVKHVTCGEGGAVTCQDPALATRMRRFRNHAIVSDHRQRQEQGTWEYDVCGLGWNYRLTDLQSALGRSQLRKLDRFVVRRRELAERYDRALADQPLLRPLAVRAAVHPAWHLYVVQLDLEALSVDRATVFQALRAEGIGVNVHYKPVHLHPFYAARLGTEPGLCPVAEAAYERLLTLPLFAAMSDADQDDVLRAVAKVTEAYAS